MAISKDVWLKIAKWAFWIGFGFGITVVIGVLSFGALWSGDLPPVELLALSAYAAVEFIIATIKSQG